MKKTTLLTLVLAAAGAVHAQSPVMRKLFASMPDSLMPTLSQTNRRDMLDFWANGMEARVHNQLNEESTLRTLGDTYALVESSAKSRVEMKLLYTADSTGIVAVISTVVAPAADSHVAFYDTEWRRLGWVRMPRPSIDEFWWLAPDSLAQDAADARLSLADLCPIEVRANPEEPTLELTMDTGVLAEKEKDAARLLVHPILYLWDGTAFRKRE